VSLQPVAVVLIRDALVNHGAEAAEVAAAVATLGDVAAVAAAHPVGGAAGHLGAARWDFGESVELQLVVPGVEGCDHWGGGGERDGVGDDVGEEHCRGVVVLQRAGLLVSSVVFLVSELVYGVGSELGRDARRSLYGLEMRTMGQWEG
jgi:hypothetical protein